MADRIEIRAFRVMVNVGVPALERANPQPVSIDLDLTVDLAPAGRSDEVADTVDYGVVVAAVDRAAVEYPAALLENLAERIAAAAFAVDERIEAVAVTVTKLRPPVTSDVATTGVRIERSRA